MSLPPRPLEPLVGKGLIYGSGGAGPQSGMKLEWRAEGFRRGDTVWWGPPQKAGDVGGQAV